MIDKYIGQQIKVFRAIKGFTQQDLSNKTNINRVSIIKIEAGNNTRIQTLKKICLALDVKLSEFFIELEKNFIDTEN